MPRKGWSAPPTPAGWYQVIRGPRPKAAPDQWRSCETRETARSKMATWAGRTKHESTQGVGGSPFQGAEIGEGHRGSRRLASSLERARRACQERPIALLVEKCQDFFQRSRNRLMRMEQERVAEQKELGAALVRLTRLHEEISRATAAPTQPTSTPVQRESPRWRRRGKNSARSEGNLCPSSADIIGASEQSVALVQFPARNRSALMATLIDRGTTTGSSHRFNPMA